MKKATDVSLPIIVLHVFHIKCICYVWNRSGLMFLRYLYIIQLFSKAHYIPMPKDYYDAMEQLHPKGIENLNLTGHAWKMLILLQGKDRILLQGKILTIFRIWLEIFCRMEDLWIAKGEGRLLFRVLNCLQRYIMAVKLAVDQCVLGLGPFTVFTMRGQSIPVRSSLVECPGI